MVLNISGKYPKYAPGVVHANITLSSESKTF